MHPLKNVFNKMMWDKIERAENYVVYFTHRGVPDDTRKINASTIKKLGSSWFTYADAQSDETLIPFHRVKRIVNIQTGESVWIKRPRKNG